MKSMKRWIVLCLLLVPLLASAESYWEGSAALQRGDAAFESGLYATSNSFAPDTRLSIVNLDNGKSTTATVSQRAEGQSGDILIFLSPKAADAIGVTSGSIARVRVTVEQSAPSPTPQTTGSTTAENPYSADQDVNPGAAYAAPGNQQAADQQATDQQAASQPGQAGQPAPGTQETATAGAQAGAAPANESNDAAEDAQILAEAEARHPQKQLFLPPREDQKFAYKPPAQEVPSVSGETSAPSHTPQEVPMAEAQPESPATPQEAIGAAPQPGQPQANTQLALPETGQQPAPSEQQGVQASPGGEKIALQPPETPPQQAGPTPPETALEQPAVRPPEQPPSGVQVVASLPRLAGRNDAATFYVQLGAYATQQGAQDIAQRVMQTYPVVVLAPGENGKQIYKVLVGPLNRAESGTLLPLFKFQGFRDAFVRRE